MRSWNCKDIIKRLDAVESIRRVFHTVLVYKGGIKKNTYAADDKLLAYISMGTAATSLIDIKSPFDDALWDAFKNDRGEYEPMKWVDDSDFLPEEES